MGGACGSLPSKFLENNFLVPMADSRLHKGPPSKLELRFIELLSKLGIEIPKGRRRPIAHDQRLAEEIMEAFLDNSGQQLVDLLRGEDDVVRDQQEIQIPLHQMEAVVSLFYSTIQDVYIGVDSHPPSRFLQVHPFLLGNLAENDPESLEDHAFAGTHDECHAPRSVRIIPQSMKALQADFDSNPDLAIRYFKEHKRHHITLLCIDPQKHALIHDAVLNEEWTGDLGLWVNTCALLFEENVKPNNNRLRLELVYPYDTRFQAYLRYVARLVEQAELLSLSNDKVVADPIPPDLQEHILWNLDSMFEPLLADVWDEFVSPDKRVSKLGPFVEARIEEMGLSKASILDAATGVGCDSAYLLSKGHDVISNEIDARLIAHAIELSEGAEPRPLNVTRFDWRHFEHLAEAETFDILLALGNSLSCLRTEGDIRAVLTRFAYLLRPDGLLIVDERNYPAMFDERRQMAKPDFRFPGRVVYCSNTIQARPKRMPAEAGIDNDVLTLEYIRSKNGKSVGTFDVLPFKRGQLTGLLEESGFRSVKAYHNLSPKGRSDKSQFVTYVASRTYDASSLAASEEVESVIAFTDLTAATDAKGRLGEQAYAVEWNAHEKRMRSLLKKYRGKRINDTGDGFLLAFDEPTAAIKCLRDLVANPGTSKLVARAGLTKGLARKDRYGNLRGRDVDVAARICDRARPNLVVADDRIRINTSEFDWAKMGRLELKGAGDWNLWSLTA